MVLEAYADILATLATIFGTILSLAYFPQAYKIYKRKSSADISLLMYLIIIPALVVWLLYGLSINNVALIIANVVGIIGASTVLVAYFIYKK